MSSCVFNFNFLCFRTVFLLKILLPPTSLPPGSCLAYIIKKSALCFNATLKTSQCNQCRPKHRLLELFPIDMKFTYINIEKITGYSNDWRCTAWVCRPVGPSAGSPESRSQDGVSSGGRRPMLLVCRGIDLLDLYLGRHDNRSHTDTFSGVCSKLVNITK